MCEASCLLYKDHLINFIYIADILFSQVPQEAADYCKKDDDYQEWGTLSRAGQRTDLDLGILVHDRAQSNSPFSMLEECGNAFVHHKQKVNDGVNEL